MQLPKASGLLAPHSLSACYHCSFLLVEACPRIMAGLELLRKAKATMSRTSPNRHSSALTGRESSPIASTPETLRGHHIASLRHTLTRKATTFSPRSQSRRHTRPSFTSSPSSAALPTRLRKSQDKRAGDMSDTTEQIQPTAASAPPPVSFSRLKEIANDVCSPPLLLDASD